MPLLGCCSAIVCCGLSGCHLLQLAVLELDDLRVALEQRSAVGVQARPMVP